MRQGVVIFVKYPEPGRVKTRLAATVGAERATEIYRWLVAEVFARLPEDLEVIVCFDPGERREEIVRWLGGVAGDRELRFWPQAAGDLGARLGRACAEACAFGFQQFAVIGTDCVEIDAAIFDETWAALETSDVVLGPSEDGGYYLIAFASPGAALFREIPWSSGRVLAETLARAEAANLKVHLLPIHLDVDTEEDWRRARQRLGFAAEKTPNGI